MEESKNLVLAMDLHLPHNLSFRSWRTQRDQKNQAHSNSVIKKRQKEEEWKDSVDPRKLVLGKAIARGNFSVVHKGSYDDQTVAVKVLHFGDKGITNATTELLKKDFINEVHVWKNLDHPNITKMIGATMTTNCMQKMEKSKRESNYCMVAEYVKGGSLRSYLLKKKSKKLPFEMVIRFALDIAKGLSYLHSKKIIHRDVKPENMLIDKKHTIKLADFGIAIFESLDSFLTRGVAGTRGYMAPEVLAEKLYGRKCDVFSFGICLWEIYCCDVAYTYSLEGITANIYEGRRPSIPATCPRSLARLMERCWDTDPKKRPEMKDVVLELEDISKSCQMGSKDRSFLSGCFGLLRHRR